MAYQKTYSKSATSTARPSNGGETRAATKEVKEGDFDTSTTHYAKDTNKGFVDNVQLWENEGQFGSYIKMRISETLVPGDYYISAKKGHVSKVTN